jgi:hypothetical protein
MTTLCAILFGVLVLCAVAFLVLATALKEAEDSAEFYRKQWLDLSRTYRAFKR